MPNNKSLNKNQLTANVNLFIMVQSTRSEITQNKKSSNDWKCGKSGELVYILAHDCQRWLTNQVVGSSVCFDPSH